MYTHDGADQALAAKAGPLFALFYDGINTYEAREVGKVVESRDLPEMLGADPYPGVAYAALHRSTAHALFGETRPLTQVVAHSTLTWRRVANVDFDGAPLVLPILGALYTETEVVEIVERAGATNLFGSRLYVWTFDGQRDDEYEFKQTETLARLAHEIEVPA
jgi:hypothetical protein